MDTAVRRARALDSDRNGQPRKAGRKTTGRLWLEDELEAKLQTTAAKVGLGCTRRVATRSVVERVREGTAILRITCIIDDRVGNAAELMVHKVEHHKSELNLGCFCNLGVFYTRVRGHGWDRSALTTGCGNHVFLPPRPNGEHCASVTNQFRQLAVIVVTDFVRVER